MSLGTWQGPSDALQQQEHRRWSGTHPEGTEAVPVSRSPESEALTGKRTTVRPHTDGRASEQQQTVAVRVDLRPGARAAVRGGDLLLTRMWPRTSYLAACASMSSSVK